MKVNTVLRFGRLGTLRLNVDHVHDAVVGKVGCIIPYIVQGQVYYCRNINERKSVQKSSWQDPCSLVC
jgi:catabolite regulation protein CreA